MIIKCLFCWNNSLHQGLILRDYICEVAHDITFCVCFLFHSARFIVCHPTFISTYQYYNYFIVNTWMLHDKFRILIQCHPKITGHSIFPMLTYSCLLRHFEISDEPENIDMRNKMVVPEFVLFETQPSATMWQKLCHLFIIVIKLRFCHFDNYSTLWHLVWKLF